MLPISSKRSLVSSIIESTLPRTANSYRNAQETASTARLMRRARDNASLFRRRDAGEFRRLALEQPAIDSPRPGGERGMGTLLDDLAAVEHQDAVEAAHRRQPVRDHDRGASLHEPLHRLLDQGLRFGIEARRRLVEDQNRRVCEKRARQRDALPLAARQLDAAFADQRAVALRQPQDELMRVGKTRG